MGLRIQTLQRNQRSNREGLSPLGHDLLPAGLDSRQVSYGSKNFQRIALDIR